MLLAGRYVFRVDQPPVQSRGASVFGLHHPGGYIPPDIESYLREVQWHYYVARMTDCPDSGLETVIELGGRPEQPSRDPVGPAFGIRVVIACGRPKLRTQRVQSSGRSVRQAFQLLHLNTTVLRSSDSDPVVTNS